MIRNGRNYKTIRDKTINSGSVPRFGESMNTTQKTKSFYCVRFKSYGQKAEISKFLIFFTDFMKFQIPIEFEPLMIEQKF